MREQLDIWLLQYYWLLELAFIILLTATCFILWGKLMRTMRQKSTKTTSRLDNIIVNAFSTPISLLIILMGAYHIIGGIGFVKYFGGEEVFSTIREVIILIGIFWVLLRTVNGFELNYRRRKITIGEKKVNPGALHAAFQTMRAIIFVIAVLTAMEAFGVSVSGLLAFGGVGSVLIGFAAKDTLSNFFSGLLIFWERPFVVGDWIRRPDANIEGVVEDIGWRMTQIRTFDQRPLYVPNSLFFNSVIENPQRMTNRRIYEYMGVRYDDIAHLPALLEDIRQLLAAHDGIDQNKIQMVNFDRYGSSSLDFFIYAMTKTTDWREFHYVKEDILLKIAAIISKHNCEFAFPTRTVHHIGAQSEHHIAALK